MRLTGGQVAVQTLVDSGVRDVFGIPGVHTLHIYDAFIGRQDITHYIVRHEQGAGFMADGYARASGRPGVALVITGPGVLNALTPVAEAFADSSSVLLLSSQVDMRLADRERGTLHELTDQLATSRPVTQWNRRLNTLPEIKRGIQEAMGYFAARRPRPIHLEIPTDVQAATADAADLGANLPPLPALRPDPAKVQALADRVAQAQNPVIFAGGGTQHAGELGLIAALAEKLGAPVMFTSNAKGCLPDDHPLCLGSHIQEKGVQDWLRESDLILAIGTHFSSMNTVNWTAPFPAASLVHIDLDAAEIGKNYPVSLGIVADAVETINDLFKALPDGFAQSDRAAKAADRVKSIRAEALARALAGQGWGSMTWEHPYLQAIRTALGRDGILSCDMTVPTYGATRHFPVYVPRTFLFPRVLGTLGFGLPAAIGAKVARPDRRVVAIAGDGGFGYTCQELSVAVQYKISLPLVLVNSSSYGVVKRNQMSQFKRSFAVDLVNPDYLKMAEAFGARAAKAGSPEDLARDLDKAFAAGGPTVIEITRPY